MNHTLTDRIYAGGWIVPHGTSRLPVINPHTGRLHSTAPAGDRIDIDLAVAAARQAQPSWAEHTPRQRAAYLTVMADRYRDHADNAAALITREMGSPAHFTAQTDHSAQIFDYYAAFARGYSWHDHRGDHTVTREPAGVVALITPWNMPHKTILIKAVPALLAGCTVVVKPAPQTPYSALLLARIAEEAALPPGVFNVVPVHNEDAEHLVTHPKIDKIAFTGSTLIGKRVASLAARNVTRVSLELGGKSAMVLTEDADLDTALSPRSVRDACLANNGQICSNQTRILAHSSIYRRVCARLHLVLSDLTVGDPADPDTDIGPLVTSTQLDAAINHIRTTSYQGATLACGGHTIRSEGWHMRPTLFTSVTTGHDLFTREVFAPVLAVTPFTTDDQAVHLANATSYGLDGSVWAQDVDRARALAARLRTGTVRINGASPGIAAPIGGFKQSGIGRELGPEGLAAFTETKTTVH